MVAQLRSHPENPEEVIDSLLSKLPESMQDKVALIKVHVRKMTPAGLSVFVQVLRQEVDIIVRGENAFEKRIAFILNSAVAGVESANDTHYGKPEKIAANDTTYVINDKDIAANDGAYRKQA